MSCGLGVDGARIDERLDEQGRPGALAGSSFARECGGALSVESEIFLTEMRARAASMCGKVAWQVLPGASGGSGPGGRDLGWSAPSAERVRAQSRKATQSQR